MADHQPEKRIKWDEEVITEHNKERGTRQKVSMLICPSSVLLDSLISPYCSRSTNPQLPTPTSLKMQVMRFIRIQPQKIFPKAGKKLMQNFITNRKSKELKKKRSREESA
jgi:hypothetical protein